MQSSPTVIVIADDLTGANDTGVQFAKSGIATIVLVQWEITEFPSACDVLVVNTESRHVSRAEAARRVLHVTRVALQNGVRFFFKKTDSTLRGNIGAELEALMSALGLPRIVFVPAFPELGRTTHDGIHFVHGRPIAESAFGRDPLNPISDSHVAAVLRIQGAERVHSLPTANTLPPEGICVIDCETTDELAQIAEDLLPTANLVKTVAPRAAAGSAVFAEQLCIRMELPKRAAQSLSISGPILLVNGSLHERALEQIANAPESFLRVRMPPEVLIAASGDAWRELLLPDTAGLQHVLLHSIIKSSGLIEYLRYAAQKSLDEQTLHLQVAERTGEIVRHLLDDALFKTLIVFGGDTLAGIARACAWPGFIPLTEAAPGITVAHPLASSFTVISKAGGFGDTDAIQKICGFVEAREIT